MRKGIPGLVTGLISVLFIVSVSLAQQKITPTTALRSYLDNRDTVFHWELKDSFNIGTVKAYNLLLTTRISEMKNGSQQVWASQIGPA